MTTWDDKPNDYEHAWAIIGKLEELLMEEAEHWWSEERHKVEIAEAYQKGWEDAKEECAKMAESFHAYAAADAIRALKDKP